MFGGASESELACKGELSVDISPAMRTQLCCVFFALQKKKHDILSCFCIEIMVIRTCISQNLVTSHRALLKKTAPLRGLFFLVGVIASESELACKGELSVDISPAMRTQLRCAFFALQKKKHDILSCFCMVGVIGLEPMTLCL